MKQLHLVDFAFLWLQRLLHAGLGEHGLDQIQDRCELHVPVFSDDCLVATSSEDYAQLLLGEQ